MADATAFRLSHTAKNQKDFKVQAMDGWKRGKPHALIVCPIYQLPTKSSQIYEQASARSVCILSYTHLVSLVRFAATSSPSTSQGMLLELFKTVEALNPSKDSMTYWQAINRKIIEAGGTMDEIWREEKEAALDSIRFAKEEALTFLAVQRVRIMKLSHKNAIAEIIRASNLDNRIKVIESVGDNGLLARQ